MSRNVFVATVSVSVILIGLMAGAQESQSESWDAVDAAARIGTVTAIGPGSSFVLDRDLRVGVPEGTSFGGGLRDFDDLRRGQVVEVIGVPGRSQWSLRAYAITLQESSGEIGESVLVIAVEGRIEDIQDQKRIRMDDGNLYELTRETSFSGALTSAADLEIGQYLGIVAHRSRQGRLIANHVVMHRRASDDGYSEIRGRIAQLSGDFMALECGQVLHLSAVTQYRGDADSRGDLAPGYAVRVWALQTMDGVYRALIVWAEDGRDPTTKGHRYAPHQALVITAQGVDPRLVAERYGARLGGQIPEIVSLFVWQGEVDDDLLRKVDADPEVVAIELNYLFRDAESVRRRYPIVDLSPAYILYIDQDAAQDIGLEKASELSQGSGVTVAVIDNGVDPLHPVLQGRIVGMGMDLIDGDRMPWETANGVDEDGDGAVDEGVGHGTFVASLIALVAPKAEILPYRVLDDDGGGTAFSIAVALADAIARGVDVVNLSLEYHERSKVIDSLIETAAENGIVVVAAAGNDGGETIPFPASDSNTIGVTATASDYQSLWSGANFSDALRIAAPGEDLYGALPAGNYGTWAGTSFACPLVSGAAALMLGLDPDLEPALIEQALFYGGVPVSEGDWAGAILNLEGSLELLVTNF